MMGRWCQVTAELLARIRARPALLDDLLNAQLAGRVAGGTFPESFRAMLAKGPELASRLPAEHREEFLEQLRAMQAAAEGGPRTAPEGTGPAIDLEKAWHGVHYLLTGSAEPTGSELDGAVLGGREIGPDRGYGPVRYLEPPEVASLAKALDGITAERLRSAYDPEAMASAGIYPGGWDDPENLEWLAESFAELQRFYRDAADRKAAVLLYIQ